VQSFYFFIAYLGYYFSILFLYFKDFVILSISIFLPTKTDNKFLVAFDIDYY
jgi:hypothetical protein